MFCYCPNVVRAVRAFRFSNEKHHDALRSTALFKGDVVLGGLKSPFLILLAIGLLVCAFCFLELTNSREFESEVTNFAVLKPKENKFFSTFLCFMISVYCYPLSTNKVKLHSTTTFKDSKTSLFTFKLLHLTRNTKKFGNSLLTKGSYRIK